MTRGFLDYGEYRDLFGVEKRELQRDLKAVRAALGECAAVPPMRNGRVLLHGPGGRPFSPLITGDREAAATLARMAEALGGPAMREIRGAIGDESVEMDRGFLHLREPRPAADDRAAEKYAALKKAARGPAMVRFMYRTPKRAAAAERRVEPYRVMLREGRYYLVAYDMDRSDWRQFGLHGIEGRIVPAGSFRPRELPPRFLREDAVGWFSGAQRRDVVIRLSPEIAASVTAVRWQLEQHVELYEDGSAEILLSCADAKEAIRWAMRFAPEAVVVSPPDVAALAAETTAKLLSAQRRALRDLDRRSLERATG